MVFHSARQLLALGDAVCVAVHEQEARARNQVPEGPFEGHRGCEADTGTSSCATTDANPSHNLQALVLHGVT